MSGKITLDRLRADHDHFQLNAVPAAATASLLMAGKTGCEEAIVPRPACRRDGAPANPRTPLDALAEALRE